MQNLKSVSWLKLISDKQASWNFQHKYLSEHLKTRSDHRWYSVRKLFLNILQNSQENTCVGASFLITLHASGKFLKTRFFTEHLRWLLLQDWRHPLAKNISVFCHKGKIDIRLSARLLARMIELFSTSVSCTKIYTFT